MEQLAQITLARVPIPSDDDLARSKTKDILKKLQDVDKNVLHMFDETAELLVN